MNKKKEKQHIEKALAIRKEIGDREGEGPDHGNLGTLFHLLEKYGKTEELLNDKNGTIFNLKYRKGFLILVSGKGMEILYYFKPFLQGIIKRQVDYFLFLLEALS